MSRPFNGSMIYIYKYNVEERFIQKSEISKGIFYLKDALSRAYPKENIKVFKDERGKPYVDRDETFISVTHTGNLVICAISGKEIGIDAEVKRENLKFERIAKRFFTEAERMKVEEVGERAFYEIWCRKEAFAKLDGRGLSYGIAKISTVKPIRIENRKKTTAISVTNTENFGKIEGALKRTDEGRPGCGFAEFFEEINGFPVKGEWISEGYFACVGGEGEMIWIDVQE